MNDIIGSDLGDKLLEQYPFLQDAAFIELNNAIEVSRDQNSTLKNNNTFVSRVFNLAFGKQDLQQTQINGEFNSAIQQLVSLDKRRIKQILKTKQGLKETLAALVKLKVDYLEFKEKIEETICFINIEIEELKKGFTIRDRVKTILNNWELNDLDISPYCQLTLLIAQLRWADLESLAIKDKDFKEWLKSELVKSCCNKFGCKPEQLVPVNAVLKELSHEEQSVKDALKLALPSINNNISIQTQRILLNELQTSNLQPVMSLKSLSSKLLEGAVL